MSNTDLNDELRPEYDLTNLKVRKVGAGRKQQNPESIVRLDRDVAEIFPDSAAVNEALRFLARIVRENQLPIEIRK